MRELASEVKERGRARLLAELASSRSVPAAHESANVEESGNLVAKAYRQ